MSAAPPLGPRLNDSRRGILWIMLSTALLALVNAAVKVLTEDYPVVEVAWARMTFNVLFLIVLFRHRLAAVMKSARPERQLARSLLMCVVTIFIFTSLHLVPLANFTSLMFLAPIIVTALSMPLLKERVGPRRWVALLSGFIGAMIIARRQRHDDPGLHAPGRCPGVQPGGALCVGDARLGNVPPPVEIGSAGIAC